ncbi:hypothetical protein PVAND_001724 [Polypedilum vanderplanki]|uniref:Nose resistant-to-fluoxetine protein N-terminal domain-containing protein n=1 Tax=Polypedilum vanderplanki TaxID=319348 RepID=A0A9J6BP25_POLVA|nr:hypothetical protein PVAND_001724 [Polypedilum vanderplanki]
MKILIFLLCALTLTSAEFVEILKNLQVLKEGKHERLIQELQTKKFEFTTDMFVNAVQTVRENYLLAPRDDDDGPITPDDIQCGLHLLAMIEVVLYHVNNNDSTISLATVWPLLMVDPWAKVQSGWLAGNIRNPGHFTQCINIDFPVSQMNLTNPLLEDISNLRGKHCTVGIRGRLNDSDFDWPGIGGIPIQPPSPLPGLDIGSIWPQGLFIDMGICFPAPCSDYIVEVIFRLLLSYLGLEPTQLFTNNRDQFCSTSETPPLSGLDIGALVLIGLGFAGAIFATIYEVICIKMKIKPNEMSAAMSLLSNGRYLFNMRKNKEHIQCLHGLRALSLIWLMLGYRFILSMVLPLINPLDFVLDFSSGFFSTIVFGSQFGVDIILFLNATLITFLFMNKMDRTGRVRIWKMYLYRFMRVTPFIGILIFFLMTLTKYSSEGPYYGFFTSAQIPACEQYWWSAMLHVQNYVNPQDVCILHTWMFSVDMQLFWFAPLLLYPLFFFGAWFLLFICLVVILSIGCASTVAYFYGFQAFFLNMLLDTDKLFEFIRMIFFATHIRMGPWLIGVFCGYICYRCKDGKSKINWFVASLLWILAISGIITVILLLYPFHQVLDNNTSTLANAMYIGFARNIFALSLAWIVIGCYTGSGYIINWILSLSIWMPFSRMGISVYIVTLSAQMVIIASQKTPLVFGSMEFLHAFDGDIILVFIFSSLTYLMIERPIMRVMKYLFSIGTTKQPEKEEINGTPHEVTFNRVKPSQSFY